MKPAPSNSAAVAQISASMPDGWGYVEIADPADGAMRIVSVVRDSDGSEVPEGNWWLTDRTFPANGAPTWENVLHIVDHTDGAGTETYTITYEPSNSPPVVEAASFETEEDVVLTGTLADLVTDPDGDALTFNLVDDPLNGTLLLDAATGDFTFTPGENWSGSDGFSLTIEDGMNTVPSHVDLIVTPVNDAPELTSAVSAEVDEGTTGSFHTVTATDIEGDALSFSLAGADAALFTLDAATGALAFVAAPDFAAPGDADGDNTYDLVLSVSDGADSDSFDFAVTVLDVMGPDTDGDGIEDAMDNAIYVANPDQRDTDGDGYGNVIDQDLDNNGFVTYSDLSLFLASFGAVSGGAGFDPDADFDGNGAVTFGDYSLLVSRFGDAMEGQSWIDL